MIGVSEAAQTRAGGPRGVRLGLSPGLRLRTPWAPAPRRHPAQAQVAGQCWVA